VSGLCWSSFGAYGREGALRENQTARLGRPWSSSTVVSIIDLGKAAI
jgi:hypothetical protein